MHRTLIISKEVAGLMANQMDIRIVNMPLYPVMNNTVTAFYGFYVGSTRIEDPTAEGDTVLGDLISTENKTALYDALVAEVGAVTWAVLQLNRIEDEEYLIAYKQGDTDTKIIELIGSFFSELEYHAVMDAVFAEAGVETRNNLRKQFTVNSTGILTDYAVNMTIHNTDGTDSSTDVYLGDEPRSDWGDIRIKTTGGTRLPYAILVKQSTYIKIAFLATLADGNNTFYLDYSIPAQASPYKIACLTDTHYDPNDAYVNRPFTLDYIDNFVTRMSTYLPDLAVNNGDKIGESNNNISNETQRLAWYQANMDHFAPVSAYATTTRDGVAMANHDCEAFNWTNVLAKHSAETWMQPGVMYGYWESTDFRFISLDANYVPSGQTHVNNLNQGYGYINTDQLTWLTNTLTASTKPCIIFCHQPLGEHETGILGLTKEVYHTQNRAAVRAILEASGKVACVLQGHMHWHRYDIIKGIPYLVMEDISEARSDELPTGTSGKWSLIEIDKEACSINFKMEAKVGASYVTVHENVIPYKTSFDSDIANFPEMVYAQGDAATYSKASILSDASQMYITNSLYLLVNPNKIYLSEPWLSSGTIQIKGIANSPNFGRGQFYFAPQTGTFKLKFHVYMVDQKTKYFKIGDGSGATATPGPYVGFHTDGHIFAQNGATLTNLQTYSLSTWYEIEVIANVATDLYTVKVDGVTMASNFSFMNALATASQMEVATETGVCYVNNLRIAKYASTEPTITAWGVEEAV